MTRNFGDSKAMLEQLIVVTKIMTQSRYVTRPSRLLKKKYDVIEYREGSPPNLAFFLESNLLEPLVLQFPLLSSDGISQLRVVASGDNGLTYSSKT